MVSQVSRETWGWKETGWGTLCIKRCPQWNELNSCVLGGQQWFVICVASVGGVWNGWVTRGRWSGGSKRPIWSQWRVRSHWSCWGKSILSLFLCQEPEVSLIRTKTAVCSQSFQGKLGVPGLPGYPGRQGPKVKIWVEELILSFKCYSWRCMRCSSSCDNRGAAVGAPRFHVDEGTMLGNCTFLF